MSRLSENEGSLGYRGTIFEYQNILCKYKDKHEALDQICLN